MNEKRAKRLRRQAREQAEGLPERAYRGVKRVGLWQLVLGDSIRKHYKLLKQGRIPAWS